jgi:hypothetical protein
MADYNSSLPVRTEADGDLGARIVGATPANVWVIDASGIGQVNLNDGTNALAINAAGGIGVTLATGSEVKITDGTDTLAITSAGSITSLISDGTDTLAVNTDGSLNVNVVTSTAGDQVHSYATSASLAAGATATVVSYTVTTAKTLLLALAHASASGKAKVEVLSGVSGSETVKAVFFISTSNGFGTAEFPNRIEVAAGDKVLVKMTNRDNQSQDVYAYINGVEV